MISQCLFLFLAVSLLVYQEANAQTNPVNGAVRFSGNNGVTSGIVEVYVSGRWGKVCHNGYDYGVAEAVCHQLGYSDGDTVPNSVAQPTGTVLGDIFCSTTNKLVLLQCSHTVTTTCNTVFGYLEVQCYSERIWDSPYNGMLRLQGGTYSNEGHVEVYCNGQWGSVCNDNTGSGVGDTVCNQLGYNILDSSTTTTPTTPVWLSNVNCLSTYGCLSNCNNGGCPSSNATCSNALSVTCSYTGSSGDGSTRYTCLFTGLSSEIITAIIFSIIVFLICLVVIIVLPLCICCCCGIGIGAASSKRRTYYTI